jgi:hypothetical protein
MPLVLAPHVEFDADKHEYWYEGKLLSGVTGLISKRLGQKMPQEFVEEHQLEGIHVHKAVQKWIEAGDPESVHPGVKWLTESFCLETGTVFDAVTGKPANTYSEVLVSDFEKYASAVDIVVEKDSGYAIYDIKKGIFHREYVTWQLSIYKYFIEKYVGEVFSCICICMKDRDYYKIFPKTRGQVEKLLYGWREW